MPAVESPKSTNRMSLLLKIVLGILAALGLGVAAYLGFVMLSLTLLATGIQQAHDDSKAKLAVEIPRFQPVQGCRLTNKTESPEGSEGSYYVDLEYDCPNLEWGTLEGQILAHLTNLGYPFDQSSWDVGEQKRFSADFNTFMSYKSSCCDVTVRPSFLDSRFETTDVKAFKSGIVKGYSLNLNEHYVAPN